jgi:hypothetical protein
MSEYLGNFASKIRAPFGLYMTLIILVLFLHLASTLDPGLCPYEDIDHLQVFSVNPLKFFESGFQIQRFDHRIIDGRVSRRS